MESFFVALNTIGPLFLMIALGGLMRWKKVIDEESLRQANSLCFRAFMPVLVFYNVLKSPLREVMNPRLMLFCVAGVFAEFVIGYLLFTRIEKRPEMCSVMMQSFFRSNTMMLCIPIVTSMYGSERLGEATIMMAVLVPAYNILAVVTFEIFRGGKINVGHMAVNILKNPLVWAGALGVLGSLTGVKLPAVVDSAASSITAATTPMALVLLGASLDVKQLGSERRNLTICVLMRLLVNPAVFLGLAVLLGFRNVPLTGIMVVFGGPVAAATFTMAAELGGDKELAAELVVVSTSLCSFTLFGWIFLLKSLGFL